MCSLCQVFLAFVVCELQSHWMIRQRNRVEINTWCWFRNVRSFFLVCSRKRKRKMIVEDWKTDTFSVVAVQVQDRLVVQWWQTVTSLSTSQTVAPACLLHRTVTPTTSNHKDWVPVPGTYMSTPSPATPNLFPKKRRWLRVFTFYPTNAAYIIKTKCHYY